MPSGWKPSTFRDKTEALRVYSASLGRADIFVCPHYWQTDFSPRSEHEFQLAYSLARDHGARLLVLHIDQPIAVYGGVMTAPPPPPPVVPIGAGRLSEHNMNEETSDDRAKEGE
jgi:hypothetical protein